MTLFRLRGYASGYASVTRETRAVTRVTRKPRVRVHERAIPRNQYQYPFSATRETTRNRVTHVTTGLSGVTDRVTNTFSRNHKEKRAVIEMSRVEKDEKQQWVRNNLPTCAALAGDFKAVFGDVRLVYAAENGHELGKQGPDGVKLSETLVGPMTRKK